MPELHVPLCKSRNVQRSLTHVIYSIVFPAYVGLKYFGPVVNFEINPTAYESPVSIDRPQPSLSVALVDIRRPTVSKLNPRSRIRTPISVLGRAPVRQQWGSEHTPKLALHLQAFANYRPSNCTDSDSSASNEGVHHIERHQGSSVVNYVRNTILPRTQLSPMIHRQETRRSTKIVR